MDHLQVEVARLQEQIKVFMARVEEIDKKLQSMSIEILGKGMEIKDIYNVSEEAIYNFEGLEKRVSNMLEKMHQIEKDYPERIHQEFNSLRSDILKLSSEVASLSEREKIPFITRLLTNLISYTDLWTGLKWVIMIVISILTIMGFITDKGIVLNF